MKATKTWIVVADGGRARIFLNDGPGHGLAELSEYAVENELRASGDINSDRPGRVFDSGGEGRHAMEPTTDAKRHEKREFAKDVASMIGKAAREKAFDRLVLVAPPKALGDLRNALPAPVSSKLAGELAKDLTHLNARDLEGHLGGVLAV